MFLFVGNVSTVDALGNYECDSEDRKTHVSCLRELLDSTEYGSTVPKGKSGLGKYKCGKKQGNKTKEQHVNCLTSLLDEYGSHLAVDEVQLTNCEKDFIANGVSPADATSKCEVYNEKQKEKQELTSCEENNISKWGFSLEKAAEVCGVKR